MKTPTNQEALRSATARKERRTSLLLGASLIFLGSTAEPLYRPFHGSQLAVRVLWCVGLAVIALALPRASPRRYAFLLPLAGIGSSGLFATTVWLNGGTASPDFQYILLLPLMFMVLFQDEVVACSTTVVGTISSFAVLAWAGDLPSPALIDGLSSTAAVGVVVVFGAFSFRRLRLAELATQQARADAIERLALSERRRGQAERLASLGHLAAGVAHEINNPLHAVSAKVETLAGAGLRCPGLAEAETRIVLGDMQAGVGRIAQIVRDLEEFSSGGADKLEPCQVDDVVGDALRLAAFKLGKAIDVRRSCAPGLPAVLVDRRKLSQVLLNLLVNAAEAMQDARTAKPWLLVAAERAGDAVEIAVQDNGPGISDEVKARLFEPFVTSKPIGKGTGLGLALSREYVMSFGGTLELQPTERGARFSIVLPAAAN